MTMQDIHKIIDKIDSQLITIFEKRLEAINKIAEIKRAENLPVVDLEREQQILKRALAQCSPSNAEYVEDFVINLLTISKEIQNNIINK